MNGNCQTCPVESQCAYPYKPTDCCDQRKFRPMKAATTMPNSLDREIFEKWAEANGYAAFNDDDNEYSNADTHHAWICWQAGAAAATERAAKICEDLAAPEGMHGTAVSIWDVATLDCAEAIIRDRSAP